MNDNKAEFKKDIKERLLSAHRKRYASALARSPMIKVVLYGLDSISWAVASRPKAERAGEENDPRIVCLTPHATRYHPQAMKFHLPSCIPPSKKPILNFFSIIRSMSPPLECQFFSFFFNCSMNLTHMRENFFAFNFQLFDRVHPSRTVPKSVLNFKHEFENAANFWEFF